MTLDGGGAPAATLVVGAGLAGLTVAYRLQQYGLPVDVVEARDRPGGRIHSQPQALGTQLTAELGGEAFDSDHAACLTLAQALGLPVVDLWSQVPADLEDTLWFGGQRLSARQVQTEWAALLQERAADWQAVQQFLGDGKRTDRIAALDALSIPDYLDQCGAGATLRQVVTTAYTIKYGIEAEVQSSLNVLGYFQKLGDCEWLFGTSDERFYLQGGNSQLPAALYGAVGDRVHLGTALEALTATADGRYQATLRPGQTVGDRRYER
ncbi:MAG TPA: FAD-dependent oxidoreductase, partial [Candidatus Obscuribacterales bacterium]